MYPALLFFSLVFFLYLPSLSAFLSPSSPLSLTLPSSSSLSSSSRQRSTSISMAATPYSSQKSNPFREELMATAKKIASPGMHLSSPSSPFLFCLVSFYSTYSHSVVSMSTYSIPFLSILYLSTYSYLPTSTYYYLRILFYSILLPSTYCIYP